MFRDDDELWFEFLRGNPAAFEVVRNRFYGMLHSYFRRALVDQWNNELDGFIQEVYLRLWSNRQRLNTKHGMMGVACWLRTASRHLVVDFIKSAVKRREKETSKFRISPAETESAIAVAERDWLANDLRTAIKTKLNENERVIVCMYLLLKKPTTVAIAKLLDLPFGTVYSRFQSAKATLKEHLEKMGWCIDVLDQKTTYKKAMS